jgi:hypothetical protein
MGGLIKGPDTIQEERDRLLDRNANLLTACEAALPYLRSWKGLSVDVQEAIQRAAGLVKAAIEEAKK